jgi:ubiquinone/menaquinone biosynthesis C-methylase UbiE
MGDSDTSSGAPTVDRAAWLRNLRLVSEQQEDALAPVYDANWGEIEPTHRTFVELFLSKLPPGGRVLDAACGTGRFFGVVLDGGHSVQGVDQAGASLAVALTKFPRAATAKHDLQGLPYEDEFDGVMCVDAMEFVPPEDWPGVLDSFRRALHPGGWLYVTIEVVPQDQVRALTEEARRSGLPVVAGEVMWAEPDGPLYHHYPSMKQVREWMTASGFAIEDDVEGPWDAEENFAYHHLLARLEDPSG